MFITAGKTILHSKHQPLYRNLTIKLVSKPLFRLFASSIDVQTLTRNHKVVLSSLESSLELKILKIYFILISARNTRALLLFVRKNPRIAIEA